MRISEICNLEDANGGCEGKINNWLMCAVRIDTWLTSIVKNNWSLICAVGIGTWLSSGVYI